jgi:hypothetical protein
MSNNSNSGSLPGPSGGRCEAAHVDDPRPCDGPPDAVKIVDRTGAAAAGCLLHAAALLASLDGGWVHQLNGPEGSAIEVFRRAQALPPFDFLTAPRLARLDSAEPPDHPPAAADPAARARLRSPARPTRPRRSR